MAHYHLKVQALKSAILNRGVLDMVKMGALALDP